MIADARLKSIENAWQMLADAEREIVPIRVAGTREPIELDKEWSREDVSAVFPGSFAPLHTGHRAMRRDAKRRLQAEVWYELSLLNADKPRIDWRTLSRRLKSFRAGDSILLTKLPTFEQKASSLEPAWFIVGIDTLVRIADTRFYREGQSQREEMIAAWRNRGVKFLVYGRPLPERHISLDDVNVPCDLRSICREVSGREFSMSISSSQIRQAGEWSDDVEKDIIC